MAWPLFLGILDFLCVSLLVSVLRVCGPGLKVDVEL